MKGKINMSYYKKYSTKAHGTRWETWTVLDNVLDRTNKRIHKKGFSTKKEAQQWVSKKQFEFHKQGYIAKNSIHFKDLYEKWIEEDYNFRVRESTLAKTEDIFRLHILPSLGKERIEDISVEDCTKIVRRWCSAFKQYRRFRTYTIAVFKFGIRMELINRNPMSKTSIPKNKALTDTKKDCFYGKKELQQFLKCAKDYGDPQVFTFFQLLAFSGMRKGEALALKWQDIDFKESTININKTLSKGLNGKLDDKQPPKTESSNRSFCLDKETIRCLHKWKILQAERLLKVQKNANSKGQLVFSGTRNQLFQPSVPDHWNRSICSKYKLRRIKIHGFRHTFCTLAIAAGNSITSISKKLGHSNLSVTESVYLHESKERDIQEADQFAKYMDK
ncbi:site-specific integrase [Lentilactobacillus hilgardii]|nr:site-specific integrase [Lentilactobacillus hilgardii]MBZ2205515.1 site-specific integrase [Lentilactobacillus hilgardii]